jgi:chromosome partition protein MukE
MTENYSDLHTLIMDPLFPELDVRLREGWHCDEEEIEAYDFITRALDWLTVYYDLYGCELVHAAEGYYYLRPISKLIKTYTLGVESMVVSQFLALMKMDPRYLEAAGSFGLADLIERIELLLGSRQIGRIFLRRKKDVDAVGEADVANYHQAVKRSLRELARLGFVTLNPDFSRIYPRKAVFRFLDPVRHLTDPAEALESLVRGENPFITETPDDGDDDE